MSWWQGVLVVLLGNLITLVPMVLSGHPGTKYGVPFPVLARASFGVRGASLAAMLRCARRRVVAAAALRHAYWHDCVDWALRCSGRVCHKTLSRLFFDGRQVSATGPSWHAGGSASRRGSAQPRYTRCWH